MDQEKRKEAKQKITNAKNLEHRHAKKVAIINEYQQGISLYLQISNKSLEDIRAIVSAYHDLATLHFNAKDYLNAGQCYVAAINQLLQTSLDDSSYRDLTELYIDLADACYELMNQVAGDEAMNNAIKAFGLIQNKTFEEQKIGDPVANLENFKKFHAHYEKKLSTNSYLKSAKFINHEHLLGEAQVARQEEQALFSQFESISISEIQEIDRSLESMLSQLSLSAAQPIFSRVFINETPSDSAYHGMAMQFLNLAKSHIQNKRIPDAIATYQQTINTLNAIKAPEKSDLQIIQSLTQQIEFLRSKPSSLQTQLPRPTYQGNQKPVPVTATGMGFFDHRSPENIHEPTTQVGASKETHEEDSMCIDEEFSYSL